MTAAARIRNGAILTTNGRWVRATAGSEQCKVCRRWATEGWRWFHNATTSSAFVCDACAEDV